VAKQQKEPALPATEVEILEQDFQETEMAVQHRPEMVPTSEWQPVGQKPKEFLNWQREGELNSFFIGVYEGIETIPCKNKAGKIEDVEFYKFSPEKNPFISVYQRRYSNLDKQMEEVGEGQTVRLQVLKWLDNQFGGKSPIFSIFVKNG